MKSNLDVACILLGWLNDWIYLQPATAISFPLTYSVFILKSPFHLNLWQEFEIIKPNSRENEAIVSCF